MKKLILLILLLPLFIIGNAQTQGTCTFIPNLQSWTWDEWPVALHFEAIVEYDTTGLNIQPTATPASVDLLLKQPGSTDTIHYGSFSVSMLPSGAFELIGDITPSSGFTFSGPFEIGALIVMFNPEHLSQITHVFTSELILIDPPIVTGINPTGVKTFNVFPNPAIDAIYVESPQEGTIAVYDVLGKQVATLTANKATEIELPVGQYYIVQTIENKTQTKKLLVQK